MNDNAKIQAAYDQLVKASSLDPSATFRYRDVLSDSDEMAACELSYTGALQILLSSAKAWLELTEVVNHG